MKLYPLWKVRIYFSLCPIIGGWMFCSYLYIGMLMDAFRSGDFYRKTIGLADVFQALLSYIFFTLAIGGVVFILYLIPAAILASVYARLKLHRAWSTCIAVTLLGGSAAFLWSVLLLSFMDQKMHSPGTIIKSWWGAGLFLFHFGAVSSLAAALMAFPKEGLHNPTISPWQGKSQNFDLVKRS